MNLTMRASLMTGALLAAAASLPGAEELEALNQTAVRERLESIVTIAGDVRRDGPTTEPGAPLPGGWGQLDLRFERRTIAWNADAPVIAGAGRTPDQVAEHRREADLRWRQTLGTPWLTFEVEATGTHEDRTDADHLGDIATMFAIPLVTGRYDGLVLAVGALHPVSDKGKDWVTSHGTIKDASWTGLGELRGVFGVELATVQMRAGLGYTPHGTNQVPGADLVKDTTLQTEAALGVTYRLTRWLRIGAEQSYQSTRWTARDDQPSFRARVSSAPLLGSLELTVPSSSVYLLLWAGSDLANRSTLSTGDRFVTGAELELVY